MNGKGRAASGGPLWDPGLGPDLSRIRRRGIAESAEAVYQEPFCESASSFLAIKPSAVRPKSRFTPLAARGQQQ